MQQIEVLALNAPARAHAEIAELGGLVGGVPALHDAVEFPRPLVRRVMAKPHKLDHAAALRHRGLLVLTGEMVFADGPTDTGEGVKRLPVGMQRVAPAAPGRAHSPDRLEPVLLIGFGDGRKAEHLPLLLRENMADQIVLVQPLHDDDDGSSLLVVCRL